MGNTTIERHNLFRDALIEAGNGSSYAKSPAERIFPATILDTGDFIVEFFGQFACLALCYVEILSLVAE